MAIEISDQGSVQLHSTSEGANKVRQQENADQQRQQAASQPSRDSVTFTQTATRLHQLERSIADAPVVDNQRVEQAKAAIKNDRLDFNANRVADKLINFESSVDRARS